jgi:hypothetical protein
MKKDVKTQTYFNNHYQKIMRHWIYARKKKKKTWNLLKARHTGEPMQFEMLYLNISLVFIGYLA